MRLKLTTAAWPIWTQIILIFALVTIFVLSISLWALRSKSFAYLEQEIHDGQEKLFSLLSSATVDAIITQDIPALRVILDDVVAHYPNIHHIDVNDAKGNILYSARGTRKKADLGATNTISSQKDIIVSGEKFGTTLITWDLQSQYNEINRHLDETRRYTGIAMVVLVLILCIPLYLLVARPLKIVNRRITTIANAALDPTPELTSSREMRVVSRSLNTLAATLTVQHEHELRYRERLEVEVERRTAELNRLYNEMEHHATHDRLTDVPNHALYADFAQRAISRAKREQTSLAILYIDMDKFKPINDRFGHQKGDEVLKIMASRFTKCLRAEDTVARLGGDEFGVLLPNIKSPTDAATVAAKLLKEAGSAINLETEQYLPRLSIGIALFPEDADNFNALMKMSDTAMYHAKEHGGDAYHFYNTLFQSQSSRHLVLKNEIQRAILEDELVLFFQPIVDLATGIIASFEALVRWQHPQRGLISPGDFIPMAEQNGQIVNIDQWVIESLIGQIRKFSEIAARPVKVSANLSSRSFRDNRLLSNIDSMQAVSALLDIEITESTMLVNDSRSQRSFDALKHIGVRLTLDDFGTGYSSLSYLTNLPISGVKIDRSFISNIDTHSRNSAVVASILGLCKQLGIGVVAEGVERKEELNWLREHNCNSAQGFYFSRPVPYKDAITLLNSDFKSLL
ncbi:MAG: EAL domain-containing protein [Gammaproteobacteria bacterium]|nr:EAL domain-containing protein [Gammaproteobacteria bacterium]